MKSSDPTGACGVDVDDVDDVDDDGANRGVDLANLLGKMDAVFEFYAKFWVDM